jgi:hypothetical protein
MQRYKTDGSAPKSLGKWRNYIEDWSDERVYGNGYMVTLVGLCIDGSGLAGTDNCHTFGEHTIEAVKGVMSWAQPCYCDVCESFKIN